MTDQYLYIVMDAQSRIKIGASCDPEKRLSTFQTANANDVVLVETAGPFASDEANYHEQNLHLDY